MLNTTYPHIVSFNDTPWWSLIYATTPTDCIFKLTTEFMKHVRQVHTYQTLVSTYAALFVMPLWSYQHYKNSSNPGCTDSQFCS